MRNADQPLVYFDNAATSWPKPPEVVQAVAAWMTGIGGSPGRSGHRLSVESSRIVESARCAVADLFSFASPERVVFTKNVTEALNTAMFSLAPAGAHVVTTRGEHNSVMRPLRHLEKTAGIRLSMTPIDRHGRWDVETVLAAIRPDTALVAVGHASNVTGMHMPIGRLIAATAGTGTPLLVDGAQAAGAIPTDLSAADHVVYAFTGHKSLLGPTGTGGMVVGGAVEVRPLLYGGTGSRSDEDVQPEGYPDSLESGTMNMAGIAGLHAALEHLAAVGIESIREHERGLMARFLEQATARVEGIAIFGNGDADDYLATVSFVLANMNPSQAGLVLDRKYGIMCRIGMHCNPNCHKSIGSFPDGTVRFSFSPFTTMREIDYAVEALAEMAKLR